MQSSNIVISAVEFDNQPFLRSLTATVMISSETFLMPATGSDIVSWSFPGNLAYALTPQGTPYIINSQAPVSAIGTLYFYFSASRYNYTTTNFTLCTLNIRCTNHGTEDRTVTYTQVYDTFPDIDLTLFINYQNTDTDTFFYRTTSTDPLTANIRLQTVNYPLSEAISDNDYSAWFTLNNATTKNNLISSVYEFERLNYSLSSVQATLTASSAPGTLSSWFSPHKVEKELKVFFVPEFPVATFVAYPSTYIPNPFTAIEFLLPQDFATFSPGVCFFGEGHTENIILSATNIGAYNYNWKINNTINEYIINSNLSSTAVAVITSRVDYYPVLPISLLISDTNNTYISATSPIFYYDDDTGDKLFYPFYATTLDISGNEDVNNTNIKQSIQVNPYDTLITTFFDPGVDPAIYLPLNGSKRDYIATSDIFFNNPNALSACYDKWDTIWKWSTFTECSAITATTTPEPSTWATVECSGTFPKKWIKEGIDNLDIQTPVQCTYSSSMWTLSALTPFKSWIDIPVANAGKSFEFSLQLSGFGGELQEIPGFTVSRFSNTVITLNVEHTVFCTITATVPGLTANDWTVKENKIKDTYTFTSIEPFALKVYTPNRYVLLNTPARIENLFERVINSVSAINLSFDNVAGETVFLTGNNNITQSFTVSYSSVGDKNIEITGFSKNYKESFTQKYPELLRVVETYDTVQPESYFSIDKILIDLPWKSQPTVGSNDWVVSDNINSCIKMFNDNLNFLNIRSSVYSDTYNEYFGWLGSTSTAIQQTTICPIWTWEDADCLDPNNQTYISWSELMSGGIIPEVTETGSLAQCGTWELQTCPLTSVVPNCLGKFCLEWRWASRKSLNSTALVTWRDTKLAGSYEKRWRQPLEECSTVTNINCEEGAWNVNIPGLDTYYDPIPVCFSQNRCSYTSIATYNNIIYAAYNTQIKLLSSNHAATFFDLRSTFNEATPFVNIKSIALDSEQKIFILDSVLSQIVVYTYDQSVPGERWSVFTTFGGVGGSFSKTKFLNPTNIHIDQFDSVWVVDSGNGVIKQYTNTGSWVFTLRDDDYFKKDLPLDVCVDSTGNVHVMTATVVRVYSYQGVFLFEYSPGEDILPLTGLRKITASYNREMIYIATRSQVIRHFRTGGYSGTIIDSKQCVNNINSLVHDEYRNLLVASDDKILKFVDTMTLIPLKSPLPSQYWKLNDLLIHDEEYVQNWVYTKIFHRLWDNIEIFRNTLYYNSTGTCKRYKPPIHTKDKITIGQNEIVTSTVINRVLSYLWDNFNTILDYYKTDC
jgi:hypothetical protein